MRKDDDVSLVITGIAFTLVGAIALLLLIFAELGVLD